MPRIMKDKNVNLIITLNVKYVLSGECEMSENQHDAIPFKFPMVFPKYVNLLGIS